MCDQKVEDCLSQLSMQLSRQRFWEKAKLSPGQLRKSTHVAWTMSFSSSNDTKQRLNWPWRQKPKNLNFCKPFAGFVILTLSQSSSGGCQQNKASASTGMKHTGKKKKKRTWEIDATKIESFPQRMDVSSWTLSWPQFRFSRIFFYTFRRPPWCFSQPHLPPHYAPPPKTSNRVKKGWETQL